MTHIVHWSLIAKRILRRIKYVFILRDLITWPYESCNRCGHCFKVCWNTKNDLWLTVYGSEGGCLCIDCFIELANKKGITIHETDIGTLELFNPR